MTPADIEHRFAFHAATTAEKRDAHGSVRQACRDLADQINEQVPDGREKSLAVARVEEAMFWANAALARQQ
ncbi:Acb2/Tad1 domain-containing protein [Streptomyces chryseus]